MSALERHDDYDGPPVDPTTLDPDPFAQFRVWLADAESAGLPDPNAMVLSTVDADGTASSRTVLLKGLGHGTFDFVTDRRSRKGRALAADTRVALLFPWYALHRQVHVTGSVSEADAAWSDRYWATRPRGSQLSAWASHQSSPVEDRVALEEAVRRAEARFEGQDAIPRPPYWGGFHVRPVAIEFWQGRPSRLHDRVLYTAADDAWTRERRQP